MPNKLFICRALCLALLRKMTDMMWYPARPGILCKAKIQYLLTCKVSRYCILALRDRAAQRWPTNVGPVQNQHGVNDSSKTGQIVTYDEDYLVNNGEDLFPDHQPIPHLWSIINRIQLKILGQYLPLSSIIDRKLSNSWSSTEPSLLVQNRSYLSPDQRSIALRTPTITWTNILLVR